MAQSYQAHIHSFRVVPSMPDALAPLLEMAHNLWWSWHPEAVALFKRLDRKLWEDSGRNPVLMLGMIDQPTLDRASNDRSFLHALSNVHGRFISHLERSSWFERVHPEATKGDRPLRIAYFSAEFGFTDCLQIYSGGLGCLAGDHIKSASELGLPLCAVGLLYQNGYFHQYLNADGWQQETYPAIDFENQPVKRVIDHTTGEQMRISVELPGRDVAIAIWECRVGRIPVYLLDTNVESNHEEDRGITRSLYGGDMDHRIKQEIVLGIGGVRALEALGEKPTVYHLNEGHAAFAALERICKLRAEHGIGFDEALAASASGNVFTTHTPVPAGIDRFPRELVEAYLSPMTARLGIDFDHLMFLGNAGHEEQFSMAILALQTSQFANGVSKLHGKVSRNMWSNLFPELPEDEVPIGHVTNGAHPRTWINPNLMALYDRYLGPDWQLDPRDDAIWESVNDIPDQELWATHEAARHKLVTWSRRRLADQLHNRGVSRESIDQAGSILDPNALTIGFARRFATYKRGTLLMQDFERLVALLSDPERPVQLLIAGKAHPADGPGKEIIREIIKLASHKDVGHRIVFLEDYDIEVGRRLVQGCDVWLNTPRRGMEASGTSGMKAAMNGVINLSVLDGWWDEAYDPALGYSIGNGEEYADEDVADAIESRALYDLLEREIIPDFFDRDQSGLPRRWIARMKQCLRVITPQYSASRMVADYAEQFYLRADTLSQRLTSSNMTGAIEFAEQLRKFNNHWHEVSIEKCITDAGPSVPVRSEVSVRTMVRLGSLRPEEVSVELFHGQVNEKGELVKGKSVQLAHISDTDAASEGLTAFRGTFEAITSGRRGFAVRVQPKDDRLVGTKLPGRITWFAGDNQTNPPFAKNQEKAAIA